MVKKKSSKKRKISLKRRKTKKTKERKPPTLKLSKETSIGLDFATKVYQKFNKIVKSIILFGSSVKKTQSSSSDIDIVVILDDVSIKWDQKLITWYRESLDSIVRANPYIKNLHITTIKLSTWWEDLLRGDPVVINMIRYGESLIDFGGFFEPLKYLLMQGRIKSTPEAVHSLLQRAPLHFARSKVAELNAIEGLYWSMVDSAHAAIITTGKTPPSPEHVTGLLREIFVSKGVLKPKFVDWFRDLHALHKGISHGHVTDLRGIEIDMWQQRTDEFMKEMAQLVNKIIS